METKQHVSLEKRKHQGDPISAYLFMLVLEIAFLLIKGNKKRWKSDNIHTNNIDNIQA